MVGPELLIILLIVMFVFGVGKLPEVGGAIGRGIRESRKSVAYVGRSTKSVESGKRAGQAADGDLPGAARGGCEH